MRKYVTRQGDCIASIAARHGALIDDIWGHPGNDDLRAERGDEFVLAEGDVVWLPDLEPKTVSVATGGVHVFEVLGTRCDFEVQVRRNGRPRKTEPWTLTIDGETIEGQTDGDGWVRASISATAHRGMLVLAGSRLRLPLEFGDLDPLETTRGVQGRLKMLGYYRHEIDGDDGPWTAQAIRAFQIDQGLPLTGEADDATVQQLKEAYTR